MSSTFLLRNMPLIHYVLYDLIVGHTLSNLKEYQISVKFFSTAKLVSEISYAAFKVLFMEVKNVYHKMIANFFEAHKILRSTKTTNCSYNFCLFT